LLVTLVCGYGPLRRGLLFALAAVFDDEAAAIPASEQPSLTGLAWMTGMHRASVKRHLNWLESASPVRIGRARPAPADARRYHMRTSYTVFVLDGLGAGSAGSGRSLLQQLGAGSAGSGRSLLQQLGAAGAAGDDGLTTSVVPWDDPAVIAVAADELGAATGRPIGTDVAAAAVRVICQGRNVRRPIPYIRRAIREDARRYLPTPAAPQYQPPAPREGPVQISEEAQSALDSVRNRGRSPGPGERPPEGG
jgi:hypothetical protein